MSLLKQVKRVSLKDKIEAKAEEAEKELATKTATKGRKNKSKK